jgi:hypothetical protein
MVEALNSIDYSELSNDNVKAYYDKLVLMFTNSADDLAGYANAQDELNQALEQVTVNFTYLDAITNKINASLTQLNLIAEDFNRSDSRGYKFE